MDQLAYDYSILPQYGAFCCVPTNLTECIWSEELSALLSVCLDKERSLIDAMSDYEKFKAFCGCIPLFKGHPMIPRINGLLSKILKQSIRLGEHDCDGLWNEGAKILCGNQASIGSFLADIQRPHLRRIRCGVEGLDTVCSMGVMPLLDGNSLLHTQASHWKAWEHEMQAILERFIHAGCDGVVLNLDEHYNDVLPDPYHVDQALAGKGVDTERHSLLLAQVFRFLSLECEARGLFMILHLYCSKEQSTSFITRTQAAKRRYKTIVTTPDLTIAARLMKYCLEQQEPHLRCAVLLTDYPSKAELPNALDFYAARYPLGCLQCITGGDFRYTEYNINDVKHLF